MDSFIRAIEVPARPHAGENVSVSQQMKAGVGNPVRQIHQYGRHVDGAGNGSQGGDGLGATLQNDGRRLHAGAETVAQRDGSLGMVKEGILSGEEGEIKGLRPGRHVKDWQLWLSDPDKPSTRISFRPSKSMDT